MRPILTPTESAALDRESAARGVTTVSLMENAGRAVARAALTLVGGAYGRRAVVVCGRGNNGGDGLVAARYLERWGMALTVVRMADEAEYRDAAGVNLRRFLTAGGRLAGFGADRLRRELGRADVVIDAIFGTGFHGRPDGDFTAAIEAINLSEVPAVAVDIPSGVEGESGKVRGTAVAADVTVTFGAMKPGLVFYPGAGLAGDVEVADIGFPADLIRSDLALSEAEDVAALLPPRESETHKRSAGVVLVLAGSRSMTGAAVLAASGAYRAGAGLVVLAVPEGILAAVEGAITETTFLPLPQTAGGAVSGEAWGLLRERAETVDAVAVGPGLSTDPETADLVRRLVRDSPRPMVVDADALNAFAGRGHELAERRAAAVITPHAGEFGRLTGMSSEEVLDDRVGHARKVAREFRCAVLLKGSRTVIAEPSGGAVVNPTGGPFLATGGTGDVLTGAIAGFVARGLRPADAAMAGAYVHGVAGRLASAELGEGMVASDVLAWLPRAIATVARGGA